VVFPAFLESSNNNKFLDSIAFVAPMHISLALTIEISSFPSSVIMASQQPSHHDDAETAELQAAATVPALAPAAAADEDDNDDHDDADDDQTGAVTLPTLPVCNCPIMPTALPPVSMPVLPEPGVAADADHQHWHHHVHHHCICRHCKRIMGRMGLQDQDDSYSVSDDGDNDHDDDGDNADDDDDDDDDDDSGGGGVRAAENADADKVRANRDLIENQQRRQLRKLRWFDRHAYGFDRHAMQTTLWESIQHSAKKPKLDDADHDDDDYYDPGDDDADDDDDESDYPGDDYPGGADYDPGDDDHPARFNMQLAPSANLGEID
jgi:hypothetical protein